MNQSIRRYKKRMLILCIMLAVVIMTTGISYAIFTNYTSQNDANTLAASCMDLEFNGQNEINLLNTYPISEGEALEQTPYTFTIKNNCDNYIEYYVIASVISTTNKVDSKYVKVSLLGDNDLNGTVINTLESISTPQSLSKYNITENYILKKGDGITKDESRTFNFRMWLDSNNKDIWTSEEVENKDYEVKISVVGTVKTRPPDDLYVVAFIDGEASTTFPTTNEYIASVQCTRNGRKVNVNEGIEWNGDEWELTTKITNGNVRCNANFEVIGAPDGWFTAQKGTLLASLRENNILKQTLTTPGKEVSAYTKDDVESQNENVDSDYHNYYITYGTGYEANGSKFNLTGTAVTVDTYADAYPNLVGKYITSSWLGDTGSENEGELVNTTDLTEVYYIVNATEDEITYKLITSNKNTTEAILASTEDDYGTSYYFRGAVKNNYVEFANKCWRIVRITGDGSVKLVLHNNNQSNENNPCSSTNNNTDAAFIGEDVFNTANNHDNAYIGFMYGTPGSSDYESTHANINKSTILTDLETWYANNLSKYNDKISDTVWCNDKSTVNGGLGYSQNITYYGAYQRLGDSNNNITGTGPSLKCIGNLSKITTKIGLLTADEITFAGFAYDNFNNSTYLRENANGDYTYWWTISPQSVGLGCDANNVCMFVVLKEYNILAAQPIQYESSIRPAISLVSSTTISGGTGTSEDPYVVN
mgnify:CR=1 FL=1